MAVVTCPACEKEVPDSANCPHCDFAVRDYFHSIRIQKDIVKQNVKEQEEKIRLEERIVRAAQGVSIPPRPDVPRYALGAGIAALLAVPGIFLAGRSVLLAVLAVACALAVSVGILALLINRRRAHLRAVRNPQAYRLAVARLMVEMDGGEGEGKKPARGAVPKGAGD